MVEKVVPTSCQRPTRIKVTLTDNYAHEVKILVWLAFRVVNHGSCFYSYEYKLKQSEIIDKTPNPIKHHWIYLFLEFGRFTEGLLQLFNLARDVVL